MLVLVHELGFYAPAEGAIHIHFDAERLCSAPVLANLIELLAVHGEGLRRLVGTNPRCRRLGGWPKELRELVQMPEFLNLSWEDARARLNSLKLSKYCDFNLKNLVQSIPAKHTFEVRIFPVWLQAQTIIDAAGLFEAILYWALDADTVIKAVPPDMKNLLDELPMSETLRKSWRIRLERL